MAEVLQQPFLFFQPVADVPVLGDGQPRLPIDARQDEQALVVEQPQKHGPDRLALGMVRRQAEGGEQVVGEYPAERLPRAVLQQAVMGEQRFDLSVERMGLGPSGMNW